MGCTGDSTEKGEQKQGGKGAGVSPQSFKRNVGDMPALSRASTTWSSMAGGMFVQKEVSKGLHAPSEQVWWRPICVG